jgi:hypothetical protein
MALSPLGHHSSLSVLSPLGQSDRFLRVPSPLGQSLQTSSSNTRLLQPPAPLSPFIQTSLRSLSSTEEESDWTVQRDWIVQGDWNVDSDRSRTLEEDVGEVSEKQADENQAPDQEMPEILKASETSETIASLKPLGPDQPLPQTPYLSVPQPLVAIVPDEVQNYGLMQTALPEQVNESTSQDPLETVQGKFLLSDVTQPQTSLPSSETGLTSEFAVESSESSAHPLQSLPEPGLDTIQPELPIGQSQSVEDTVANAEETGSPSEVLQERSVEQSLEPLPEPSSDPVSQLSVEVLQPHPFIQRQVELDLETLDAVDSPEVVSRAEVRQESGHLGLEEEVIDSDSGSHMPHELEVASMGSVESMESLGIDQPHVQAQVDVIDESAAEGGAIAENTTDAANVTLAEETPSLSSALDLSESVELPQMQLQSQAEPIVRELAGEEGISRTINSEAVSFPETSQEDNSQSFSARELPPIF